MLKLGSITMTRRKHYDRLKYYLANQVLVFKEDRVPSSRELSLSLDIPKSSISRALLQLCECDGWLQKMDLGSPRNSYYKIIANWDECEQYKNYHLLSTRRKNNFKRVLKHAGQNPELGQNPGFKFGTKEWAIYYHQFQSKQA